MEVEAEVAAAPAPTPAAPSAGTGVNAASLAAALGSLVGGASAAPAGPSLNDVLRPERVAPLLSDERLVSRLAPFLPPEHQSPEAMREVLNSVQFKHQLGEGRHPGSALGVGVARTLPAPNVGDAVIPLACCCGRLLAALDLCIMQ